MENKKEAAQNIIQSNAFFAAAAGAIPIPAVDVGAVTLVQLDMLKALCRIYSVNYSEIKGKAVISALSGSIMARYWASAIKATPGLGTLIGGISMSLMSGANTYSLGKVFDHLLSQYGSLDNFNLEEIRKVFREELSRGKELIKKKQEEDKKKASNADQDQDMV